MKRSELLRSEADFALDVLGDIVAYDTLMSLAMEALAEEQDSETV